MESVPVNKTSSLSTEYNKTHTKWFLWKRTHLQKSSVDRKPANHNNLTKKAICQDPVKREYYCY